ncbi:hypothetical protein CAL7716_065530 [Calothrix sp. PCC 7716]|nr:hypothetical protein CAL7716_065530 [Calothrix sp. PCC 7716]
MSEFISTAVILIVVVIIIRSIIRSINEHNNHVRTVEQLVDTMKIVINLEEKGETVEGKKDKEYLQKRIQEAQAAPKKYHKQAERNIERTKQYLEQKKQDRIKFHQVYLEAGEAALDNLRGK